MTKQIIYNKNFDKNKIKNLIEWTINNYGNLKTYKILDKIKKQGLKYSTKAGISLGTEDLIIPKAKKKIINQTNKDLKKVIKILKLGKINENDFLNKFIFKWTTINNLLTKKIVKNFKETNILNPVYMMIISGARGNLSQIKQIIGFRGLISDSEGKIIKSPIKTNLKEGLTTEEYFISCFGARKGIIDTGLKTANSGYLTRRLIFSVQNLIVKQPDCQTLNGSIIKININNKENYFKSIDKLLGRVINENIKVKKTKFNIYKGQDLCKYLIKILIKNRKYILIRKITNCKINVGICQLCYGWDLTTNKLIKIGEAVGILAAQSIGEPGTQLTMRTFHTGGIFKSKEINIIESPFQGIIKYNKKDTIKIKTNYLRGFLLKNEKTIFLKKNKFLIKKINLPKYSILLTKNNKKIHKNEIIIQMPSLKEINKKKKEIIKNVNTIKTKNDGLFIINFIKGKEKIVWIINGKIEKNLLKLKMKNKKVITFTNRTKSYKKNKNNTKILRQQVNFKIYQKIKVLLKENKKEILIKKNYNIIKKQNKDKILLFKDRNKKTITNSNIFTGMLTIKNKNKFIKGQIIETIYKRTTINIFKTGSIFQANKNSKIEAKSNTIIEKNSKIIKINSLTEKTNDIVEGLPKIEEILEAKKTKNSISIKNNVHILLQKIYNNYKKKYCEYLSAKKALLKMQETLIENISKVYSLQNVNIADKHIEIITKQMTSKVLIKESKDKNLLIGEILDLNKIEKINENLNKKIKYEPIIIGISKLPATSESFISATCFQETTRMLIKSALIGKIDWLKGLKENIIIGKLIPAGTGYGFENKNIKVEAQNQKF